VQERRTRLALTASVSRRTGVLAGVAAAVVLLDQLTKTWALHALDEGARHVFWTLHLRLTFNSGMAFSLGEGKGWLIGLLVMVIAVVVARVALSTAATPTIAAAGLVVGGAIGNLADRAFRDGSGFLGGRVVDFVDLEWWPVFNVADAAVVLGGIAMVFLLPRDERSEPAS
jgi:signal peptidase II